MNPRLIVGLVVLGAVGVSSWFALGSDEVVKWNDRIVAVSAEFSAHAGAFAPKLEPWAKGVRQDVGSFRVIDDAYEVFARKTRDSAARVKAAVPPKDPLCTAFHASVVEFADLQVRHLDEIRKIVDLMRKYNQPSDAEMAEVERRVDALQVETNAAIQKASQKQAAMAKKFRVKLFDKSKQ